MFRVPFFLYRGKERLVDPSPEEMTKWAEIPRKRGRRPLPPDERRRRVLERQRAWRAKNAEHIRAYESQPHRRHRVRSNGPKVNLGEEKSPTDE
jgi:hypothetical protein